MTISFESIMYLFFFLDDIDPCDIVTKKLKLNQNKSRIHKRTRNKKGKKGFKINNPFPKVTRSQFSFFFICSQQLNQLS